jgi:signal peptidase I
MSLKTALRTAAKCLLLGSVVSTLILVHVVTVSGKSMRPAIQPGDHLLVIALLGGLNPHPGDLVIVSKPDVDAVKRVLAAGGDRVCRDGTELLVNGAVRAESPFIDRPKTPYPVGAGPCWDIPAGNVFVMGDDPEYSFDSRWSGPIPPQKILGRVLSVIGD